MKHVFILNRKTQEHLQYALMEEIKENFRGQKIIIEKTKEPGYAELIAKKYALGQEEVTLYACGGDGTVHEVINGIAGCSHITLVVIPMGRGNDFIKSFAPLEKEDFLHLANYKDSVTVQCDLLKVDGEYAVNTVSFGFDVHIAENVNRFRSLFKGEGTTPYYTGMLASLVTLKNDVYKIQLDQEKLPEQEEMFVVFGNGQYYGGGYRPCPQAQPDDGQMDVCLVHPLPKHKLIQLADVYRTGQHVQLDGLTKLYTAKVAHLDTDNLPVSANLDGEIRRVINPTIELCPGMIRLALPIKKTGE